MDTHGHIVRPILLYGVAIWWKALDIKYHVTNLNKIQRLVLLGSTGAMKTTPSEALEIITNTPPIDIFAKGVATKTAARLLAMKSWDLREYGHSTIVRKLQIARSNFKSDYMISTPNFNRNFIVRIPSRLNWTTNSSCSKETIDFYTDGSKTGHGSGAGVWSKWQHTRYSYKLPDFTTVFQSEIFAILMTSNIILDGELIDEEINIYVDSQAALKALGAPFTKSSLTKRCLEALEKICEHNTVTLIWVPGHSEIEGNEYADLLARQGSSRHRSWTVNIECPMATVYKDITDTISRKWQRRWENSTVGTTFKKIWTQVNTKASNQLWTFSRHKIRTLIYSVTGHWNIGRHAHRMGISTETECKGCDTPIQEIDAFHYWCDCPSLARNRLEHFEEYFMYELPKLGTFKLENFSEYNIGKPIGFNMQVSK